LYLKGSETPIEDFYYLKEIVHSLGLESRVILDVTEYSREELAYIISHADLFVSPSKWEGFGYTPIEAAVFKVPVIVSNINTLTEVTRGKVPSFDPESPEELGNLILSILSNPPSENELSSLSSYYLQEYSIERQTSEFVNLLLNT
jgi:glycosyltransferase involved in cell wall biosynthesis